MLSLWFVSFLQFMKVNLNCNLVLQIICRPFQAIVINRFGKFIFSFYHSRLKAWENWIQTSSLRAPYMSKCGNLEKNNLILNDWFVLFHITLKCHVKCKTFHCGSIWECWHSFFFFFSYKNIKITVHILTMKAKLPIKKSTLTTLQYCIYAANLVTYSQNKLQESMHTLNFFCIFLVLHNNPDVFVL